MVTRGGGDGSRKNVEKEKERGEDEDQRQTPIDGQLQRGHPLGQLMIRQWYVNVKKLFSFCSSCSFSVLGTLCLLWSLVPTAAAVTSRTVELPNVAALRGHTVQRTLFPASRFLLGHED